MQSLLPLLLICVIILASAAAPITASIEWRLLTTSTSKAGRSSGRLLFQSNSPTDSWKSVCSSGFTDGDGDRICRYLGWGESVKSSFDTLPHSVSYPTGMTDVNCWAIDKTSDFEVIKPDGGSTTKTTPDLTNFFTLCGATLASFCDSGTAVHLSCGDHASRAGFEVGVFTEVKNSSGSDALARYIRAAGQREGESNTRINGRLEMREPHSTTWGSFCFSDAGIKKEAADAMCSAFSYEEFSTHLVYYTETPAADSAPARYGSLSCPAAATTGGSSSLASCSYADLSTANDCSASTRPTTRLRVQCLAVTGESDEQTTIIIAVTCSVGGVLICIGFWIYICKFAGRPADGSGKLALPPPANQQGQWQLQPPPQHQQQQWQQPPPHQQQHPQGSFYPPPQFPGAGFGPPPPSNNNANFAVGQAPPTVFHGTVISPAFDAPPPSQSEQQPAAAASSEEEMKVVEKAEE